MAHFFWGNIGDQHKYHLANWGFVTRRKEYGGLGIPNIKEYNMALLASWGKRFFDESDSDWKKIIRYKYRVNAPNLLWAKGDGGSTFWKSITWALAAVNFFYRWKLGNGELISFWHDTWVGECSLKVQFWDLYCICNQTECTVAQVWDGRELKLTFRRCVDQSGLDRWELLLRVVQQCTLSDGSDMPSWSLESNGLYSVKSFYKSINFGGIASAIKDDLWKIMCPQKIHVFLWLCAHNKILTRDNLAKRREVEDPSCLFCAEFESVQHLMFDCVVAQHVWGFISDFFEIDRITSFDNIFAFWRVHKKACA